MATSAEKTERLKALYRQVEPLIEKLSGQAPTEAWFADRCAEAEAWIEARRAENVVSSEVAELTRRVKRLEQMQAERNCCASDVSRRADR